VSDLHVFLVMAALLTVPFSGLIVYWISIRCGSERAADRGVLVSLIVGVVVLGLAAVLVLVPGYYAYRHMQRHKQEQALLRAVGVCTAITGVLALIAGGVAIAISSGYGSTPVIEATFTPHQQGGSVTDVIGFGPGILSVWMLFAGSLGAAGYLLFRYRFSLRDMLLLLMAASLLASLPQIFVKPREYFGIITAYLGRSLDAEDWQEIKGCLTRDALVGQSDSRLKDVIEAIEVERARPGGMIEGDGVRLRIVFSEKQPEPLFHEAFYGIKEEAKKALTPWLEPGESFP